MSVSRRTRTATIARTLIWSSLLLAAVSCAPDSPPSGRSDATAAPTRADDEPLSDVAATNPPNSGPEPAADVPVRTRPGVRGFGRARPARRPSGLVFQDMSFQPCPSNHGMIAPRVCQPLRAVATGPSRHVLDDMSFLASDRFPRLV